MGYLENYKESAEIQALKELGYDIENASSLFDAIIEYGLILPSKSIQAPVIKAYLLTLTSAIDVLGILFSYGVSGCEKSDLTKIASAIHGLEETDAIVQGSTTAAAIRNIVNQQKYGSDWKAELELVDGDYSKLVEYDTILLWDDINASHLRNETILSMFKSSYTKKSSWLQIAIGGEGRNMKFNCFSKKVTGSIHPIWQDSELSELKRRVVPIKHAYYDSFSDEDKAQNLSPDDERLILWDYLDFSGYNGLMNFWQGQNGKSGATNLDVLQDLQRDRRVRNYIRKHDGMTKNQKQLSFDLIISLMVLNDISHIESCRIFSDYWKFAESEILSKKSALEMFLSGFVKEQLIQWIGMGDIPHEIDSKTLAIAVRTAYQSGQIYGRFKPHEVTETMGKLGYEQQQSFISSGSIAWVKTF